jgi:hypothetical protein
MSCSDSSSNINSRRRNCEGGERFILANKHLIFIKIESMLWNVPANVPFTNNYCMSQPWLSVGTF